MTDELERDLSKTGSFCSRCGERIEEGEICSICGQAGVIEKYSDPDFDEYFNKVEKDNEGIEEKLENLTWEEVPD